MKRHLDPGLPLQPQLSATGLRHWGKVFARPSGWFSTPLKYCRTLKSLGGREEGSACFKTPTYHCVVSYDCDGAQKSSI